MVDDCIMADYLHSIEQHICGVLHQTVISEPLKIRQILVSRRRSICLDISNAYVIIEASFYNVQGALNIRMYTICIHMYIHFKMLCTYRGFKFLFYNTEKIFKNKVNNTEKTFENEIQTLIPKFLSFVFHSCFLRFF